jgi:hypothetical protein
LIRIDTDPFRAPLMQDLQNQINVSHPFHVYLQGLSRIMRKSSPLSEFEARMPID